MVAASAQAHDPRTQWRTLRLPHVRLHFPIELEEDAVDMGAAAENAYGQLRVRLEAAPDSPSTPIDVVLTDEIDQANGFAQSVPYNLIGLNAAAPGDVSELSDYDDWNFSLIAHELTHIVHINTMGPWPRLVNTVFGRWVAPNGEQPTWFVEGMAVYFETMLTSGGRNRSSYFDMILRLSVLEDTPLALDEISGGPWRWPQGSIPYLYGGAFLRYIAATHGEAALPRIAHHYGDKLIPYALNQTAWRVLGTSYPALYNAFLVDLKERYAAQAASIEAAGQIEGERLTRRGQQIGPARVAADGTLYFVEAPLGGHAVLKARAVDGTERAITWVQPDATVTLFPDGRSALLSQLETFDVYRAYNDLFSVELASGKVTQLTHGKRWHDPDLCADGRQLVFVAHDAGHSVLMGATWPDLTPRVLADLGPRTQIWTPRCAPDGQRVVFTGQRHGARDVYVLERGTGALRQLTDDRALDGGPVFSRDGAFVVYHSDQGGVFDLFARPVEGGPAHRLTRVLGGALHPEPTAADRAIIFRTYTSRGFDLARLALPEPTATAGPYSALPLAAVLPESRPAAVPRPHDVVRHIDDYSAWPTVLPHAWLPYYGLDTRGTVLGATVAGSDAVGLHQYALTAWGGMTTRFAGFALGYQNQQFHPGLYASVSRALQFAPVAYVDNAQTMAIEEEAYRGSVGTTWPLWARQDDALSLNTSYNLQRTRRTEPRGTVPGLAAEDRFASVLVALVFSNAHSYVSGISAQDGHRLQLTLRLEDPWMGSRHRSGLVTARWTHYLENPWLPRHVLASDVSLGVGQSDYAPRSLFSVGGLAVRDLLLETITGRFGASEGLRGFSRQVFAGNIAALGHLEYRLPVYDVERGIDTLPFFVRTVQGALFVDGAALADTGKDLLHRQHYSAGIELGVGLLLGYNLGATWRLGYGHGLGRDRVQQVYTVLGNTF